MTEETFTAVQARKVRLLAGKPLAEVDRLWRIESKWGTEPQATVTLENVCAPVDYAELTAREQRAERRGGKRDRRQSDTRREVRIARLQQIIDLLDQRNVSFARDLAERQLSNEMHEI